MQGRVLGVDLGTRRIGVAVSDADRSVATPIETVERSRRRSADHRRLNDLVDEWEAVLVVVGLPRSLDGSEGRAATAAREEIDELSASLPCPVATYDERLTTVTAHRSLDLMGFRSERRRTVVDQLAAAVILQGWLDQQRLSDPASGDDTPFND